MTINELREKRNQAWNAAKAFVETKRDKDGLLSEEDAKTYAQMEKKVQDYGAEIERMEAMSAMEAQLNTGLAWTKGTATRSVTLSSAQRTTLLNWMASMKSFTGTFAVSSFSGSTQIGSTSSKTATVQTTAANSGPALDGFTYADSYTTTKSLTGNDQLFVQDYSILKVTPGTATAKNGASISNYTASCNGRSSSNTTGSALSVGKIAKSGSVTVTLTITDSRGYTASVSQTITVIPYAKPKVSSVTLRRTNDIEAEMQLKFSGSISPVTVDGTQKNSVVYVRYRYKKTSESSYGSYTSIYSGTTKSGTSFSYSNLELCSLDANSSYDFHLQIQDKLYSLSSLDLYFTVPQGTPLIALRKKKVGINTPDPQATLDVDGSIHMNGVNVHGKMGRVDGSTTDLNNVKTPGYYFAYSASTEKHFPTTTIGMLEVFLPESYFIQQRYTVYDGSRMYIRGNYGGTWSSWYTVSLTKVT